MRFARRVGDGSAQRLGGEGTGGDDDIAIGRQGSDFLAGDCDAGVVLQRFGDGGRKAMPVHRQGAAGRQLVSIGGFQDQRAGPAHFLMQQAHRIVGPIIGTERVGADQFGQAVGLVGKGGFDGPHFMQHHVQPGLSRLPGSFRPGQPAADYVNFFHGGTSIPPLATIQPQSAANLHHWQKRF